MGTTEIPIKDSARAIRYERRRPDIQEPSINLTHTRFQRKLICTSYFKPTVKERFHHTLKNRVHVIDLRTTYWIEIFEIRKHTHPFYAVCVRVLFVFVVFSQVFLSIFWESFFLIFEVDEICSCCSQGTLGIFFIEWINMNVALCQEKVKRKIKSKAVLV